VCEYICEIRAFESMWAAEAHNYSFYVHPSDKISAVSEGFLSREENAGAVCSWTVRILTFQAIHNVPQIVLSQTWLLF